MLRREMRHGIPDEPLTLADHWWIFKKNTFICICQKKAVTLQPVFKYTCSNEDSYYTCALL